MEWIAKNPQTIVFTGFFVLSLIILYGEVVALTWDDIDYNTNRLTISKSSQYITNKGSFKKAPKNAPKNATSKRVIKLPQVAIKKLKALKKEQSMERLQLGSMWIDTNNILIQNNGDVMFPTTPTHWFKKWLKKTGLPQITFHQLRHTNASILISQGVDVVTVSKRLGHSRPSTTTDIYSHMINKADESAAAILDERFRNV